MANLIKNALIKQLSKFLKNVSANQINISTLKGEGEMKNIQLDENVLMDLIELPTWLRITNAKCNKASVKIQWTKLKTNPIVIFLDKIELDMEIADPLREYTTSSNSKLFDKDNSGAYGFIDKCIDAIQLNIDSITITIKSKKFNANLNMSNIYVYSVTPNWKITNDIRNTRLKDLEKEEIILFKEISWEICRLEAYTVEPGSQSATSIKLIMNPSKIQIALKKKLTDKSLITSTFKVLLNEIYWMANDIQLKAAIGTYNSLSKLMTKSFAQKRKFAYTQQQQQQQQSTQNKTKNPQSPIKNNISITNDKANNPIDISKVFLQYDIKETSLHFHISILNIHLYADENYSGNKLIDGGALQVLFKNVCIDHYPYHKVGTSIKHWHNYNSTFKQREDWSKNHFHEFVTKLETIINKSDIKDLTQIRLKNNLNLLESCTVFTLKDFCVYKVTTNMSNKQASASAMKTKKSSPEASNISSTSSSSPQSPNDFLKSNDYFIEQQLYNIRPFISANYAEFNLPNDTLFANFFFSEFYFPEDVNYPLPSPQIFVQISPILINVDFLTLLWVNTLLFSLWREKLIVDQKAGKSEKLPVVEESLNILHIDTFFECIMPKITLSIYPKNVNQNSDNLNYQKRPNGFEIGFARVVLTNQSFSASPNGSLNFRATSDKCYQLAKSLVEKNSKFNSQEMQINQLAPCFSDLIKNENLAYFRYDLASYEDLTKMINTTNQAVNSKVGLFLKSLNKNTLSKNAAKDIWTVEIESMWLDMFGKTSQNSSFIQNTSFKVYLVNVWDFYNRFSVEKPQEKIVNVKNYRKAYERLGKIIEIQNEDSIYFPDLRKQRKRSNSLCTMSKMIKAQNKSSYLCKKIYSNLNIIGEINELHVTCDHSQILFLLRLLDTIEIFGKQIQIDTEHTLKYRNNNEFVKDNNNNNNGNKMKIKSIKLDDLAKYLSEEDQEDEKEESSVNLAFLVNKIDIELSINDLRKETSLPKKPEESISLDDSLSQIKNFLNEVKEEKESISPEKKFDENELTEKLDDKSITREDFELIAKQLDKEFMNSYIKYIYGLSSENPNLRLSFQSVNANPNIKVIEKDFVTDSGYVSSEKSSLSVSFSSKSLSSHFSKLTSKISETVNDNDMFIDDNDNLTVILSLEQDDTSSLISVDAPIPEIPIHKTSPSRSLSSTSESSSLTASVNLNNKPLNNNLSETRSFSVNSGNFRNLANVNEQTQTTQAQTSIKIKLNNFNLYLQASGENLTALARLDQIELRNKKSEFKEEKTDKEVLVRFKKLANNPENKLGLVEVRLENFKLDLDIPSITGIVELVDDDDDFDKVKKESIAVCISIKNCEFNINDDPFHSFEDNPKLINISIDQLLVNKLANNQLIINQIKLANTLKADFNRANLKSDRKMSLSKEIEFLNQFKNDMTFLELNSKFKFNSDKFASLVHLLRKAKQENHQVQSKFEFEKKKYLTDKDLMEKKLSDFQSQNEELKKQIEKLKKSASNQSGESKTEEGFILTDKNEASLMDKIELERKQFESLLLGYQQENELLKSKLKKNEEHISLLNIERECLMKKLNHAKF